MREHTGSAWGTAALGNVSAATARFVVCIYTRHTTHGAWLIRRPRVYSYNEQIQKHTKSAIQGETEDKGRGGVSACAAARRESHADGRRWKGRGRRILSTHKLIRTHKSRSLSCALPARKQGRNRRPFRTSWMRITPAAFRLRSMQKTMINCCRGDL